MVRSYGVAGVLSLAILAMASTSAPAGADVAMSSPVNKLPRNARPMRRPGAPRADNPTGCSPFNYYGGRVVSNVQVVEVYWTSAVDPIVQSFLPGFLAGITDSSYFDLMSEYTTVGLTGQADQLPGSNQTIGRGTFLKAVAITPSVSGTTITDAQIQTELAAQISAGKLPAPANDAGGNVNTVYMIGFPAGYTIQMDPQSASCSAFCAYHGTVTIGGKSVGYGIVPDMHGACGNNSCGQGSYTDVVGVNYSHELAETVTDLEVGVSGNGPLGRPIAWYADGSGQGCGEIADICDSVANKSVGGYTVEPIWSNLQQKCAVAPAIVVDGGVPDSGSPADAAPVDAAPADDGGAVEASSPDAGSPDDAAAEASNAGDAAEAGAPVHGLDDGGGAIVPAPDASNGNAPSATTSGCSCEVVRSGAPSGAPPVRTVGLGLLAMGLVVARRRRRS